MELIADILLAAGALGAAFYCFVLGRRLNRFNDLEKGVGGAVAVLSAQVDDLGKTLSAAQLAAENSAKTLADLTERAEQTNRQLELQMAALHDIPTPNANQETGKTSVQATAEKAPLAQSQPMFVRRRLEEVAT